MALGEGASLVGMSVLPAELAASEEVRCCLVTVSVWKESEAQCAGLRQHWHVMVRLEHTAGHACC